MMTNDDMITMMNDNFYDIDGLITTSHDGITSSNCFYIMSDGSPQKCPYHLRHDLHEDLINALYSVYYNTKQNLFQYCPWHRFHLQNLVLCSYELLVYSVYVG